ncbi:YqgQ family protein [Ammoniphilus resinae]|uniref:Uncharacterized protein YqgQ n=1 Tax=Ammoniphilus resinae TaxID=861532 RepID=A0ABS4GUJ8_9BACL|nr:YqgQ family protein [Ammoniphilus resinae]MBP1933948.1 uncharacterized protein YqgQ [Ammoniphilus resinae]
MQGPMTFIEVKDFLRRFGVVIYTGDALGDCLLMEEELKELYEAGLADDDMYRNALMGIRRRVSELNNP